MIIKQLSEVIFKFANAGRPLKGKPADQFHHGAAKPLAQEIPEWIADKTAGHGRKQDRGQRQFMGRGQRTGSQQKGQTGNRDPELLRHHP